MSTDLPPTLASDRPLILASASEPRRQMLEAAGLSLTLQPARIDEEMIRQALSAQGASPRDQADALAEAKANKIAQKNPTDLVLGSDQILALKDCVLAKPESMAQAREQLLALSGQTHQLLSAAVLYDQGAPIWRHVSVARLTMRPLSDAFVDHYLARAWPAVAASVGAYQVESLGIRLFERIEGDHFTILGLPLLPLLSYLSLRGFIAS